MATPTLNEICPECGAMGMEINGHIVCSWCNRILVTCCEGGRAMKRTEKVP